MTHKLTLADRVIEFFFPQYVVDRYFHVPEVTLPDGRSERVMRWIWHPMTREQRAWVAQRAGAFWLRWVCLWLVVLMVALQAQTVLSPHGYEWLGERVAVGIHLFFSGLAVWTLAGVAKAVVDEHKEKLGGY